MTVTVVTTTRDLKHFRKLPTTKITKTIELYTSFCNLLIQSNQQGQQLRSSFFSSILGIDQVRSVSNQNVELSLKDDERIIQMLKPDQRPGLILIQGQLNFDKIDQHWSQQQQRQQQGGAILSNVQDTSLLNNIVIQYAIVNELENLNQDEDKQEDVTNLSMFMLACFTYELSHWIYVNCHGYRPLTNSDDCSLRSSSTTQGGGGGTIVTNESMTSLNSSRSILLSNKLNNHDVGVKSVQLMFGVLFELLTYAMGDRQVVKRRLPMLRSAVLNPALVYGLLGDSPLIKDVSNEPVTHARWHVPWRDDDDLNVVVAASSPVSGGMFHGQCQVALSLVSSSELASSSSSS
ncbi:hypothetical protein OIO90_004371 [Microbotryomycetes sp. JL221]|nr:hypothetical protein OIO90_004371 [Microbotryomycetes sp. JL221]